MADKHLMYMSVQDFSTGTWGGAVLEGFTVKCGDCQQHFVVKRGVITSGGLHDAKDACNLHCPYCGCKKAVEFDNDGRILDTRPVIADE